MLSLLHIENIAVIESADITLDKGLTVLSGETGAGKSIVLDSIGALMGQRTSKDLIRNGAQKGFVSALFTEIPAELQRKLEELELLGEEPDTLQIQRQIGADGKTICRINMRPVPVAMLKTISPYLINIHGQHDGQKLMDEQCHIEFLDHFCCNETLLTEYQQLYYQLTALKRRITELDGDEQARLQRIDTLEFHAQEIAEAELSAEEEFELLGKKELFDNAESLLDAFESAYIALDGVDLEAAGVVELLENTSNALADVSELSEELQKIFSSAEELKYLAMDLRDTVATQRSKIEFSPEERAFTEERLDQIYRLKQKYGKTIEDILAYHEQIAAELDTLQAADETRVQLRAEYREKLMQAKALAARLTEQRREGAGQLSQQIASELSDLDMTYAKIEVQMETGKKLTVRGMDMISFLISVNPGEPLKPLSKVASGGELSRIMLAMKNVLTAQEAVGTLIFDEIDTGVSGRAAQKIAQKLMSIATKKQTLCVTHLPQIAAMADQHLLIAKQVRNDRSFTEISPLAPHLRTHEIARMVAGDYITETTLTSANELLDAANHAKNEEKNKNAAI